MPSVGRTLKHLPAARLLLAAELMMLARQHLLKLEPQERRRMVQLLRRGRGRPSHLTERERRELARLLEKTEPREFIRSATKRATGIPLRGSGRSPDPS